MTLRPAKGMAPNESGHLGHALGLMRLVVAFGAKARGLNQCAICYGINDDCHDDQANDGCLSES